MGSTLTPHSQSSSLPRPQGVEGSVLPFPAVLSPVEGGGGKILVAWDVAGTHASLGQLLLLGRAAHCVSTLERSLLLHGGGAAARTLGAELDAAVGDLAATFDLLAALLPPSGSGADIEDLSSLTVGS